METFFKHITPITYWFLAIIWLYIFIFYIKKIKSNSKDDKLLGLLLIVLSIDAFRTLFESLYFGTWYTSLSGLIPIAFFEFLAQPQVVFFPKIINLITAIIVLIILINRWLPSEIKQKEKIKTLIEDKNSELLEKNKELNISTDALEKVNSELELAKEKAEISEKYLDNIINNIGDPVFVKDEQSRFLLVNDACCKLFGYERANMIGKTLAEEVPLEEQESFLSIDKEVLKTGQENINEESLSIIGKQAKIISTRKTRYIDRNGNKVLIGIIRDFTERKQAEEELRRAKEKAEESDGLKTEFINNMSHEIRTPMNGIMGFSEFLNTPNLTDKKRKHYINIIKNSGNQLMRVIDDILEISTLETKQVKVIEKELCLNDLLLELFSIFDIKAKENKTPLYLKKGLSDQESIILTDETKLNKILSNLLENALKFTTEGFIELGYQYKDEALEIYVKDTGIGIIEEKHETIFLRFSQEEKSLERNIGGLGLGLSIAKENTELIGGTISLQSEKGKGSTFLITIPYKRANTKSEKQIFSNDNEKTLKKEGYVILIAEDEEVNFLYINLLLESFHLNLKIIHAKNGKEAVEICKTNGEIDFVLMDIKMPLMDGFKATEIIKKMHPELPIVAQTAYSTNEDKKLAISAGCDDFISKPINNNALKSIMCKYLKIKE